MTRRTVGSSLRHSPIVCFAARSVSIAYLSIYKIMESPTVVAIKFRSRPPQIYILKGLFSWDVNGTEITGGTTGLRAYWTKLGFFSGRDSIQSNGSYPSPSDGTVPKTAQYFLLYYY
jgi:hypothetical protein